MAATPEILSKLNIGSGMNNSEIIAALVNAEKAPVLDRIERDETQAQNKISAYVTELEPWACNHKNGHIIIYHVI